MLLLTSNLLLPFSASFSASPRLRVKDTVTIGMGTSSSGYSPIESIPQSAHIAQVARVRRVVPDLAPVLRCLRVPPTERGNAAPYLQPPLAFLLLFLRVSAAPRQGHSYHWHGHFEFGILTHRIDTPVRAHCAGSAVPPGRRRSCAAGWRYGCCLLYTSDAADE